jgi:hypothetical protein
MIDRIDNRQEPYRSKWPLMKSVEEDLAALVKEFSYKLTDKQGLKNLLSKQITN